MEDISESDAEDLDMLLAAVCRDKLQREERELEFWRSKVEEFEALPSKEVESDHVLKSRCEYARKRMELAHEALAQGVRREMRWITSSLVSCGEPQCPKHRAVFVGVA